MASFSTSTSAQEKLEIRNLDQQKERSALSKKQCIKKIKN
jgi:hypothetical protein